MAVKVLFSKDGRPLAAKDENAPFGRLECRRTYVAARGSAVGYPDNFLLVELEDLSLAEARAWCEPVVDGNGDLMRTAAKRLASPMAIERREVGSGRDTLRGEGWIRRSWLDADVRAALADTA